MAPPKTYRCEGLILGYKPLGEADLLVTMFTRDQGKVHAVGKGARRSTSKLMGHLEPLTAVKLFLAHGRFGRAVDGSIAGLVFRDENGPRAHGLW